MHVSVFWFHINICISLCVNIDIDAENGYNTHSLHLRYHYFH